MKTNVERQVSVIDTKGLLDTAERSTDIDLDGLQLKVEAYFALLFGVGLTGVDAIFLVCQQNRFHKDDVAMLNVLLKTLFVENVRSIIYLVLTRTENHDADSQEAWLEQEMSKASKNKSKSNFKPFFDLIDQDRNRIFFIDNKNPCQYSKDPKRMMAAKENNVHNAQLLLKRLHLLGHGPVPLIKVLCDRITELEKLDKTILASIIKGIAKYSLMATYDIGRAESTIIIDAFLKINQIDLGKIKTAGDVISFIKKAKRGIKAIKEEEAIY